MGSHRSVSQCLYNGAKELENTDREKIDTWVIMVKGVGSEEEKEQRVDSPECGGKMRRI